MKPLLLLVLASATLLLCSPPAQGQAKKSIAEMRDGVYYVDGEPFLRIGAYFGFNTWTNTEAGSASLFVTQPLEKAGDDFYSKAGFNYGQYNTHPQWFNTTPFDPALLRDCIARAEKAKMKVTLSIWLTPSEKVAQDLDLHWINENGEKIPFGKTPGMHHNPELQAKAMVETYKDVFDFIRDQPTVADIQIGGERWPYDFVRLRSDVSFDDFSLNAFRDYLKQRHTLSALSQRFGGAQDFYASWEEVFPPISKGQLDYKKRKLPNYDIARWDWYNFRKAQTVKVWVAMLEALQKLDGRRRPINCEYGHGSYYSMGFNPYPEICAKAKNFSVGDGDFQPDLSGMLAGWIMDKGCGNGPWINNELDAGTKGNQINAAYLRRHIWGHFAVGAAGYNIWTFMNLQGFPYEFGGIDYSAGRPQNLPPKYFEVQHTNQRIRSLGNLLAGSKSPKPAIALMLLDDAIFHYYFSLSYHQDGDNLVQAMAANGLAEQLTLYSEYHLDNADLSGIKTILLPRTPRITDARAKKLAEFVARGGTLVLMGPTGRVDEAFKTYDTFPYGPLGEAAGVRVQNLKGHELLNAPLSADWNGKQINLDTTTRIQLGDPKTQVLAKNGNTPLVTLHPFGKGRCIFMAGYPFLLDDNDPTGHLLAAIATTSGAAPAATLRSGGALDNGVFTGRRVGPHGTLLLMIENADRAHDLEVTLDPQTLGLNPGGTYQVFECFSEETHSVSAANHWRFPTMLEPVGVRCYFITAEPEIEKLLPGKKRMIVGRERDTVLVANATAGAAYTAVDILNEKLRYDQGFVSHAQDVNPSAPKALAKGFAALDVEAFATEPFNTMVRGLKNLISTPDAILTPGPTEKLGSVPVMVPQKFILCQGEVRAIPVNRQAASLHFFHGGNYSGHRSGLGYYRVTYGDGTQERVPVVLGTTLFDFSRGGRYPSKTEQIWSGNGRQLHRFDWTNPHPERVIDRIDIVSTRKNAHDAIAVWAITVQENKP